MYPYNIDIKPCIYAYVYLHLYTQYSFYVYTVHWYEIFALYCDFVLLSILVKPMFSQM